MKRALLLGALMLAGTAPSLAGQAAPARPAAPAGRAAAAPDIVGKWEFTVESTQGAQTMTVTFARANGVLSGTGEGQFGAFQLSDVMLAASDLSFSMRFQSDNGALDIPFKGKVTNAAAAEGTLTFSMGDTPQTIPWKAKKLP